MGNNTEVVFDNIEQRIFKEIEEAHYAIFVSVAWFTNKKLFNALLEKAKGNCYVSIIIQLDDINSQCGIDYSQIQVGRSECFMISKEAELLHEKFCVIDFRKVITGSYNWTYKAAHNSENILILDDPTVATQYISRFEQQKSKYAESSVQQNATSVITTESHDENRILCASEVREVEQKTPAAKVCLHCNNEIHDRHIYCAHCGTQQKQSHKARVIRCYKCDHVLEEPLLDMTQTKYCPNCGNSFYIPTPIVVGFRHTFEPEIECPICRISPKIGTDWNYCPECGLKKNTHSSKKGKNQLQLHTRDEFSSFKDYQLCPKCNTSNYFGDKFCRNCRESLVSQAMDLNGHGWIDLGLSVLWSTESMEDFYPWKDSSTTLTKYSERLDLDFIGDEKDVASVKWGEKWRTPTKEEFQELINECSWQKIVIPQTDEHALKVTGPNGNYILLKTTGASGCRRSDKYNLGFCESEYQVCKFRTSSEIVIEGRPPVVAIFSYWGYESFNPTLTFQQEYKANHGTNPVFHFGCLDHELGNKELMNRLYEREKKLKEKLNESDLEERKRNEEIDMKKRHELWLGTPFKLEKPKRLEMYKEFSPGIVPGSKTVGYAIRPVADKKWQGKL